MSAVIPPATPLLFSYYLAAQYSFMSSAVNVALRPSCKNSSPTAESNILGIFCFVCVSFTFTLVSFNSQCVAGSDQLKDCRTNMVVILLFGQMMLGAVFTVWLLFQWLVRRRWERHKLHLIFIAHVALIILSCFVCLCACLSLELCASGVNLDCRG